METFSALLVICAGNSSVPGEFPAQRPVARTFDVFFDLRLNRRLNKQWWSCHQHHHCLLSRLLRRYRAHYDVITVHHIESMIASSTMRLSPWSWTLTSLNNLLVPNIVCINVFRGSCVPKVWFKMCFDKWKWLEIKCSFDLILCVTK